MRVNVKDLADNAVYSGAALTNWCFMSNLFFFFLFFNLWENVS